jgi:hypothetical protein
MLPMFSAAGFGIVPYDRIGYFWLRLFLMFEKYRVAYK